MSGYLTRLSGDVRRDAPEPAPAGSRDALRAGADVAVIAEVKRASPSQGAIAPDADVVGDGRGATRTAAPRRCRCCAPSATSAARLADLRGPRRASALPVLAKDFIVFPEQVAAAADGRRRRDPRDPRAGHRRRGARGSLQTAELLGMDALVEVHTAEEVERALALEAAHRSASTPATWRRSRSIATASCELLATLPTVGPARRRVGHRGRAADVEAARDAGADAVLVGTSLMRAPELARRAGRGCRGDAGQDLRPHAPEDVDAAVEAGADLVGFILRRRHARATSSRIARRALRGPRARPASDASACSADGTGPGTAHRRRLRPGADLRHARTSS